MNSFFSTLSPYSTLSMCLILPLHPPLDTDSIRAVLFAPIYSATALFRLEQCLTYSRLSINICQMSQ